MAGFLKGSVVPTFAAYVHPSKSFFRRYSIPLHCIWYLSFAHVISLRCLYYCLISFQLCLPVLGLQHHGWLYLFPSFLGFRSQWWRQWTRWLPLGIYLPSSDLCSIQVESPSISFIIFIFFSYRMQRESNSVTFYFTAGTVYLPLPSQSDWILIGSFFFLPSGFLILHWS